MEAQGSTVSCVHRHHADAGAAFACAELRGGGLAAYSGQCARDYITGGVSPAWRGAYSAAVEKFSDLLHRSCSAGRRGGVPNVQTDRAAKFVLGRGGVDRFALCG